MLPIPLIEPALNMLVLIETGLKKRYKNKISDIYDLFSEIELQNTTVLPPFIMTRSSSTSLTPVANVDFSISRPA